MSVGILGGGQLGLMLAESLQAMGESFELYDPDPVAPAAQRLPDHTTTARWDKLTALRAFFDRCDVVTYESENVLTAPFFALQVADRLLPSIHVLETVQDRIREKTFLSRQGLPHASFRALNDISDLPSVAKEFGYPFILKSARGGYDGKGQYRINTEEDLMHLPPLQEGAAGWWVIEEVVEIALEVSCIVARSQNGDEVTFPLFENEHRNHILDFTVTPARVEAPLAEKLREVALEAARKMNTIGVLTVEFFLSRSGGKYGSMARSGDWFFALNEFAPRPHNSGHVTRNSCNYSQFDALAKVLTGQSLAPPELVQPDCFCMGQLLGEVWLAQGTEGTLNTSILETTPSVVELYDYGKRVVRPKRKMGHFIIKGPDPEAALTSARAFRSALRDQKNG